MKEKGIYFIEDELFLNYEDFFIIKNYIKRSYIEKQLPLINQKKVYIQDNNYINAIIKTLACLDLGLEVVLGTLNIPETSFYKNSFYKLNLNYNIFDLIKEIDINKTDNKNKSLDCYLNSNILFFTSGSTGEPKLVKKSISTLVLESIFLKKLFKLSNDENIYSFVPINHIYGFIYSFIIPFYNNYSIHILPTHFLEKNKYIKKNGVFITLPSLWSTLENILTHKPKILVSSGSQLGCNKETEFKLLKLKHSSETILFEILGSTETGGFGYRNIESLPSSQFYLFNKCRLKRKHNTWYLLSPYTTSPYNWYKLSDHLSLLNYNKFKYIGRNDKIIKYGQKRISISSIEKNLSFLLQKNVICIFNEDPNFIKGGSIEAYIEGEKLSNEQIISIKQKYLLIFDSFFPNKFYFINEFPKNIIGKTTIVDIKKIIT